MRPKRIIKHVCIFFSLILLTNALKADVEASKNKTCASWSDEILQRNREMEAALRANDMMLLASIYSDSCVLIGENTLFKGREEIDAYWMSLKDKGVSWEIENIKIDICDDLAVQQGISKLTFLFQDKPKLSVVRFTLVWKKIDEKWLIEIDHYSIF